MKLKFLKLQPEMPLTELFTKTMNKINEIIDVLNNQNSPPMDIGRENAEIEFYKRLKND